MSTDENMSPQMQSEVKAVWMALWVCCPESKRLEIKQQIDSRDISPRDAAKILKIPEAHIRNLISPMYDTEIHYVLHGRWRASNYLAKPDKPHSHSDQLPCRQLPTQRIWTVRLWLSQFLL